MFRSPAAAVVVRPWRTALVAAALCAASTALCVGQAAADDLDGSTVEATTDALDGSTVDTTTESTTDTTTESTTDAVVTPDAAVPDETGVAPIVVRSSFGGHSLRGIRW